MRKLIFALLVFCQLAIFAQTEKTIESAIKDVMVYQQGAQITRSGKCTLQKGKFTLVFSGLSSKIDPKSIQAKGTNDIMIISVSHSIDYLNKNKASKEIERLELNRKDILDSLKMLKSIKVVYNLERDMILSNKAIGGDNGVNISDLQNAAAFFRTRLIEIETKSSEIERKAYKLKNELVDISKQLLELNSELDLPTSQIKIVVSSEKPVESVINLDYIIAEAGWIANYDIRIKDIDSPLNLTYKAKVTQNTGEDWENVNLTLSTGNPSISNYKPDLETYYLTFNNYYANRQSSIGNDKQPFQGTVYGQITDAETGEPLIGASVVVKGTTQGTVSDVNGNYKIDLSIDNRTLVFSYIGYDYNEQYVNSGVFNVALNQSILRLEEVVVVGYGVSSDDASDEMQGRASGVSPSKKKVSIPLAIQKRETSTEFKIEVPYSIPSDNHEYDVSMVEYTVPVQYSYSAVPKISDDAFLIAKLTDWTQYNMLNGNANLFFKGVFQGETYLDLKSFEDTLTLSIGRDKDIIIDREIQKDFTSRNFVGNNKKELRAWDVTLKNNKEAAIKITIEDQFPISKTDEITVEQIEQTGAILDKESGKLTWDLELAPNEKKVLTIKYSVKYPKDRKLVVE